MSEAGGRSPERPGLRSLDDLWTLRTDYEDVVVPQLGGEVFRVYALTGTARAYLMGEMGDIARTPNLDLSDLPDPAVVRRVLEFQGIVVAAALGYPREDWPRLGDFLSGPAIEVLYAVASRLSGLDEESQDKEKARQRRRRSAASGSD